MRLVKPWLELTPITRSSTAPSSAARSAAQRRSHRRRCDESKPGLGGRQLVDLVARSRGGNNVRTRRTRQDRRVETDSGRMQRPGYRPVDGELIFPVERVRYGHHTRVRRRNHIQYGIDDDFGDIFVGARWQRRKHGVYIIFAYSIRSPQRTAQRDRIPQIHLESLLKSAGSTTGVTFGKPAGPPIAIISPSPGLL